MLYDDKSMHRYAIYIDTHTALHFFMFCFDVHDVHQVFMK